MPKAILVRNEKGVVRRPGTQPFYGCSEYKAGCSYKISLTIKGITLTEKPVEALVVKGKTDIIKGFTSASGKPFDAILMCNEHTKPEPWPLNFELPPTPANSGRH